MTAIALSALPIFPFLVFLGAAPWKELVSSDVWPELVTSGSLSIRLALSAGGLAVGTAFAGAVLCSSFGGLSRRLNAVIGFLLSVPAGISMLVLGLGTWLAYRRWIDPFEGSFLAMVVLQAALFAPLAFRTLWPVAQENRTRLAEAAGSLGASPLKAFYFVEWPFWRRPLFAAFGITVAGSLGELAAVSLFYSEKMIPLSLWVARWSSQYRFEVAVALAALLLVLSMAVVSLTSWFGNRRNQND